MVCRYCGQIGTRENLRGQIECSSCGAPTHDHESSVNRVSVWNGVNWGIGGTFAEKTEELSKSINQAKSVIAESLVPVLLAFYS